MPELLRVRADKKYFLFPSFKTSQDHAMKLKTIPYDH